MADLQGRIALVTGAAQGIGRAIALELSRAGATLVLADINEAKLADVAAEIQAAGGQAAPFRLDVSSEESIKSTAKAILERFGKVEILINNAGITRDGLMMSMKRADWDLVLAINLTGPFLLTQALLRPMIKNRWGRIVNMASIVGRAGQAGQVNYSASKAGLIGLTMSLAREVASRGITVNAVAPGFVETPMTAVLDEKQTSTMMAQIPLNRQGKPEDIARAIKFLASDEAAYITGHVLDVNGGMLMGEKLGSGALRIFCNASDFLKMQRRVSMSHVGWYAWRLSLKQRRIRSPRCWRSETACAIWRASRLWTCMERCAAMNCFTARGLMRPFAATATWPPAPCLIIPLFLAWTGWLAAFLPL
jgi:3-oxoacyl-[acyl-carrier protein] reductase